MDSEEKTHKCYYPALATGGLGHLKTMYLSGPMIGFADHWFAEQIKNSKFFRNFNGFPILTPILGIYTQLGVRLSET